MSKDRKKKNPPSSVQKEGAEIIEITPPPIGEDSKPAGVPSGHPIPEEGAARVAPSDDARDDIAEVSYKVPKVRDLAEARCIIESLLFTTVEPLPLNRLSALLPPLDPQTIRKLIVELQGDLDARRSGLQIVEVGRGFQMASRPEYGPWVLGLLPHRRKSSLSAAALETLSIIAYKQPITRAEIDQIRGVDSSGTVRHLLDLGVIKAAGQKEVIGRPTLYQTTDQFLKIFGLRRLTDLPALQDLRRRYKNNPSEPTDETAAADAPAAPDENPGGEPAEPPTDDTP